MATVKKDTNQVTPLMQQYLNIKANYPDVILFFRLGDFYEMFGDDAIKAHKILEVILTKRQTTPMCGVPYHSVNNYIRKLVKAGFKIAICEQLEDPASVKGIVKRGVVRVITPGTILEDNLLDSKQNNFLMSVILDNMDKNIAIAISDISTGDFFTYRSTLSNLENEITKYKPNEIIVSQKDSLNEKLQNILQKFEILASPVKDIYVDSSYCEQFIKKILNVQSLSHFNIADKPDIISAVGMIFVYIQENQPQTISILQNIKYIENNDFMVLDSVAIKNLEILRSLATLKQEGSLLDAIDSTTTPMGARLLRNWLIKPLLNVAEITNRQNKTKIFVESSSLKEELRQDLKAVCDLDRIVSRIVSGGAHPKEMLALKDSLRIISNIFKKLESISYFSGNETDQTIAINIINKIIRIN